ncbi:MAG TPA: RES family NAD+ phosphorylase [Thermomicrobiales bacterium]|jgi:RES domain-containing protein
MTESVEPRWDAELAVASADIIPFKQAVWRGHRRRYQPLDPSGSLRRSGRFHRATDQFPSNQTWPALYTACDLATALGEIQRSIVRQDDLIDMRFTEIWVEFDSVVDCRDLGALGLRFDDLFDDFDYGRGHALALAALGRQAEGLLVPSATRLGANLIIFPHRQRSRSVLVEVRSIDPRLVKHARSPESAASERTPS